MKKINLLFTAILLLCCVGTVKAEEVTIDGIKYDVVTEAKKATVIEGGNYSGDIVIPSEITYNNVTCSVTSIGNSAFSGCKELTSITIPNSVTSIGEEAFGWCYGLTSATIGNSVTSIGSSAFEACSGLTSITIPNSVASIGRGAFWNCSGLTSITIPNSVTSIGQQAFGYCSGLTSITIPNSVTSIGNSAFYYCSGLTSITIPNSVTSIGEGAFWNCSGLESIVVDPGNTKYDSRENCNAIIETESNKLIAGCKNTVIPNSVTSIGNYAFDGCSGLTSIEIPNSVTSIGNQAFYDCSGLTSVTIPNSVTSIGYHAFSRCSGLTSVTIGNSVTSIGNAAFRDCSGLTSATIGNSVTSIGNYAFNNCSGLTSITIPNSVTSIGEFAFSGCSGLTSITIPNSVTSIGEKAFIRCSELTDVYCLATNVPETYGYNPFEGSYPEYMTLHVPAEAINSYKTTEPWSSFGNIVTLNGDIVETPKCDNPVIKYNNGEIEIECETTDAEFVTKITSSDINSFYSNSIALTATYNISVYATAAGYDNSDTVNATLCWIENGENDENNNVINIPATAVLVTSSNGSINISCSLEGESVELYTSDAMFIESTTIENGCATIESGLSKGDIAIVKIGEKSIKIIID